MDGRRDYDDLVARFDLGEYVRAARRSLDLLHDGHAADESRTSAPRPSDGGSFVVVERRGGYGGYGDGNAPVRRALQVARAGDRVTS